MKKIIISVFFLTAAQVTLLSSLLPAAQPVLTERAERAPDFTLPDLEKRQVSLSEFKGRPAILFFWTTWCPYCVKELRQLNTMHPELSKDGIEIFSINEDEYVDKVPKFVKNYSLTYRVLLDTERKASDAYGIVGVPTYILVNKEGRIVFNNHYFPHKEYKGLISK